MDTISNYYENFNSHPHEEDDWIVLIYLFHLQYFNSHPHEEDDLFSIIAQIYSFVFQLTSSRGG